MAVIGISFDTDQFVALTGLPEPEAYAALDAALAGLVVVHTGSGYRFRHPLIRDALLDDIPPAQQRLFHHQAAARLSAVGAPPARIAHHLIAAGQLSDAVPHVIQAVETEAAIGAYRDALALVDAVRDQANPHDRGLLLALRANLLAALGDRSTIDAYRDAIAVAAESERSLLRARMAQSAVMEGDLDTAAAVLDGLEPNGGPADVPILLAQEPGLLHGRRRRGVEGLGPGLWTRETGREQLAAAGPADSAGSHRTSPRRAVLAATAGVAPCPGRPGTREFGVRSVYLRR